MESGELEWKCTHRAFLPLHIKCAVLKLRIACGRVVIFGGDLNLRDTELAKIGGVPSHTVDLWEASGKRKEAQFTWDMSLNDNKEMPSGAKFKCRCRFDRLYLRQPSGETPKLKPVYFELAGIERLKDCRRFCSDHWGILSHLDIL